ncbi:MAG: VWA domain-containing protein [Verrucomicrobiota bacterium]
MISDFHFIRPWWLLALLPLGLLVWSIRRRQDAAQAWRGIVAPHLLPFLLSGSEARHKRFTPLLLIGTGWLVAVLAIAGPAWRREPAPFAEDTAALAIVVKVSPSMMTEDVQPGRLARGVQKIHDLLALRRGAKTALIAYAGSAHLVMPATTDAGIINTFAQALDPKIMPGDGDDAAAALRLADQALTESGGGSILWITDSLSPEQNGALAAWRKQSRTTVRLLPPLLPGSELDALTKTAAAADASLVRLAADGSDVSELAKAAKFATAAGGELSDRWQESGYWLTPLLAALTLPFFRRGWMTSTAGNR